MKIYMTHIRQAKLCLAGTKAFFISHNLDWKDFVKNGINEEKIIQTNDAMALKVVEIAHGRK